MGFAKFKNSIFKRVLFISALGGFAFACLAVGVFLLISKLSASLLAPWIYVLVGVGALILSALAIFLLFFPTDKKIAKKIDNELHLSEKTQTMVEFKHSQDELFALQRANAEETLAAHSPKQLKRAKIWQILLAPVLALAVLTTAICIPAKQIDNGQAPPPATDVFVLSSWQETALNNLIDYVEQSTLQEPAKTSSKTALERLLTDLKQVSKISAMKTLVQTAMQSVDSAVGAQNTNKEIATALYVSESSDLKRFAESVISLDAIKMRAFFTDTAAAWLIAQTQQEITLFVNEMELLLANAAVDKTDLLYTEVQAFALSLKGWLQSGQTGDAASLALSNCLTLFMERLLVPITLQADNKAVKEYVISQLTTIFALSADDLPILGKDVLIGGSGGNEGDENGGGSGGKGDGELVLGGNGTVYDPDQEEHVDYSEVINAYYAKLTEKLLDGTLTEEMKNLILEYFTVLFGGSQAGGANG